MRWEDERYVRVYTRDTGDWLALSFDAQALFLMLLRKTDRIGDLHLGKRGKAAIGACVGHSKKKGLALALEELLADGCVRISDNGDRLHLPNFLEAQEVAKSPAERKREQRERDAAQALQNTQLSRDVTPVTIGHEMSPRAVPSRAVPNPPCRAEPVLPEIANAIPMDGIRAAGALELPGIVAAAEQGRRLEDAPAPREKKPKAEKPPNPRHAPLVARLCDIFASTKGTPYAFNGRDAKAVQGLLGMGTDDEIAARWLRGLNGQFKERVDSIWELAEKWNALAATGPPTRVTNIRKSPVGAEDIDRKLFAETGRENGF